MAAFPRLGQLREVEGATALARTVGPTVLSILSRFCALTLPGSQLSALRGLGSSSTAGQGQEGACACPQGCALKTKH